MEESSNIEDPRLEAAFGVKNTVECSWTQGLRIRELTEEKT